MPQAWSDAHVARATWSRLAEPGDRAAGAFVRLYGARGGLDRLRFLANGGEPDGAGERAMRDRWAPRLAGLDLRREFEVLERLGGRLVIPGDDEWPQGLHDLGDSAPHVLWVRGSSLARNGVAIVGSRAATRYGEMVAAEWAGRIAEDFAVVSGGAYGIDAAAHRGALATGKGAGTVAVLAGGVDRLYPAGNAALLTEIAIRGVLLSELAPGSSPGRHRFLARNRVIAAMTAVTVVVEASYRSGAISTANHAFRLLRPVGAVPGPITSVASAGCHRLLREAEAVCVTHPDEVLELAAALGQYAGPARKERSSLLDGLDPLSSQVLDAMPVRASASLESITRVSGLARHEVLGSLGLLELAGRVRRNGERWMRVAC